MPIFYLDTNVLLRLDKRQGVVDLMCRLQTAKRIQVAIGWHTIWEMAGVFTRRPDKIAKGRRQAEIAVALLLGGGLVSRGALDICKEALRRPAADRWAIPFGHPAGHAEWVGGVNTLSGMTRPERDVDTIAWYQKYKPYGIDYLSAETAFSQRIQNAMREAGQRELAQVPVGEQLDGLERDGWLTKATQSTAKALLGEEWREQPPDTAGSDWFGPLGRFTRVSMAYVVLQGGRDTLGARAIPKDNDYHDISNIIIAGCLGNFVTADRNARIAFKATWPQEPHACMDFKNEFVSHLRCLNEGLGEARQVEA